MELNLFFKDLKIVELSSVLAGPLAGSFFTELGAEVIKIENKKTNGDVTRGWKLNTEPIEINSSAYYHSANYCKTSVFLDLKNEADHQQLHEYLQNCDVIITNYLKETAEALQCDIPTLRSLNPKAIIVQLSAYEYEDNQAGFDLIMQAECGYISMTGNQNQLAKMPVAMIDILASHQIKEAILIGLMHKLKSNQGSVHYVSLYKSGLSGLVNQATNYLMEAHIAQPIGTLHPNIAPYGEIITSSDGIQLMLAVGSDAQFRDLLQVLGIKEFPESYRSNASRVKLRQEMNQTLNQYSALIDGNLLQENLHKAKVPFARIKKMNEVFEHKDAIAMVVPNPTKENDKGLYVKNVAFQSNFF